MGWWLWHWGKNPISSSESSITKRHSPVDSSYRPGPRSDRVNIEPFFPPKKTCPIIHMLFEVDQVSRNCSRETMWNPKKPGSTPQVPAPFRNIHQDPGSDMWEMAPRRQSPARILKNPRNEPLGSTGYPDNPKPRKTFTELLPVMFPMDASA